MKRFQFEHESLLRLKQQLRRQAEHNVALAARTLERTRAELAQHEHELEQLGTGPVNAGQVALLSIGDWYRCGQLRQQMIRNVQAKLASERVAYETARQALVEIETEVETLSSLRLTCWREHQTKLARERQNASDENALRQWMVAQDTWQGI